MSLRPWVAVSAAAAALLHAAACLAQNQPAARMVIHAEQPGKAISPMLHGIFFEDINFGADGGLYAELVQNRSFQHKDSLYGWSEYNRNGQGSLKIEDSGGLNANNPHFLRVTVQNIGQGYGVANAGFGGIPIKQGDKYNFSIRARANRTFGGGTPVMVLLMDSANNVLAEARLNGFSDQWKEYTATLTATSTQPDTRLVILPTAPGQFDLDVISLFPEKTFHNRPNGMRADLAQMLADLHPAFMRFPGGCIIEGDCRENMYRWKNTIGDIAQRSEDHNRWNDALPTKSPQYYQTFGLGFFEYFQLCEDMGCEPLPVLNCGMSCQFQQAHFYLVPLNEMGPYVQDALDLIEFANGPAESTWGSKGAGMGHPAPFNMKYLAVGNEQWGEDYFPRYKLFHDAIKAKYPNIKLITSAGPSVDDMWWNLAYGKFKNKSAPAEIVDEHYYRPPRWFYQQADRYDKYDRSGPKVFAGEYAAHPFGLRNNLDGALAEAAFMTGLERNSDVVTLSSYAPLYAKIGDIQWVPDMIWFTNTAAYGTPSYYALSLFSNNVGDAILPMELSAPMAPVVFQGKGIQLFAENCIAEYRNLKITSGDKVIFAPTFTNGIGDLNLERGEWSASGGVLRSTYMLRGRASARVEMPTTATISVQVRKTSGTGGIGIKAQALRDEITWLLGAAANSRNEMQLSFEAYPVEGKIEEGRWYDVKLELDGHTAKAYVDGKLAIQRDMPDQKGLFAVATRDTAAREIIVKAVNPTADPISAAIQLTGTNVQPAGRAIVLASTSPLDENSLDAPSKVAPKESTVNVGPTFTHAFPPYSITVLRMKSN